MPNTTNYSFPTPADTDLVKNGADAIRDLGDAVDTAMNTALGTKKSGMVLLSSVAFNGVASQSVSNVFDSTYQNYIFTWNVTCAATTELWLRLRTASDDSGNNYYGNRTTMQFSSSTVTGGNYNADSKINFGEGFAEQSAGFANIMNPNVSSRTLCLIQHYGNDRWNPSGFQTGVSTQYTGITILGGTQNITGSVSVYGYNK